jgi:hypothetical protein
VFYAYAKGSFMQKNAFITTFNCPFNNTATNAGKYFRDRADVHVQRTRLFEANNLDR